MSRHKYDPEVPLIIFTEKVESVEYRHIDIEEYHIGIMDANKFLCVDN